MKLGWILAGLVLLWLLTRKTPAASAKPAAGGPQSVDVGNSVAGAPIYNLSGTLAGRHLGVDNTSGVSLNPTTTSASTGAAGASQPGASQSSAGFNAPNPFQNYEPGASNPFGPHPPLNVTTDPDTGAALDPYAGHASDPNWLINFLDSLAASAGFSLFAPHLQQTD